MLTNGREGLYRLLRWSERYTNIDMVYFASGGFWIGVGQASNALSALASALLFGNLLPREAFGVYKYILTLSAAIGSFSLVGLRTALARSVSMGFDGDLLRGFYFNVRWSLLVTAASFAGALYYFTNSNGALAVGLLAFGSVAPILNSANLYTAYLNGKRRFKDENLYSIGRDWLPLIALATTLFLTKNVVIISLVYFFSHTGAALLFFRRTVRTVPALSPISSDLYPYGLHLSAISVIGGLISQADKILVFHYLGAAELALYTFATAIPLQFHSAANMFYSLALPKFSIKEKSELKRIVFRRIIQAGFMGALASIVYIAIAPYAFALLFPLYLDAIPFTQLFALSIAFASMGAITAAYFDSQKEIRKKYVITISSNIVKLGLMATLLHTMGIQGILVGILLAWVYTLLLQFILIKSSK